MVEKDQQMNVREAAKECGRNPETIRRWVWSGKLPAQKLGNQLFIKRSDLANYCRETAVAPYQPRERSSLIERMREPRGNIRANMGREFGEDEISDLIHGMREERMEQIEQSLLDGAAASKSAQKEDFLERAIAFREKLRTRGYPETDTAALVKKSREGRIRELRQSMRGR